MSTTTQEPQQKRKLSPRKRAQRMRWAQYAVLAVVLLAGRVDGAINDNGVVYDFAKDNPSTEVVKEFSTGEQYGMLFKKDDANAKKLADTTNEVIKAAKADGKYNEIYKKWFGVDAPTK